MILWHLPEDHGGHAEEPEGAVGRALQVHDQGQGILDIKFIVFTERDSVTRFFTPCVVIDFAHGGEGGGGVSE